MMSVSLIGNTPLPPSPKSRYSVGKDMKPGGNPLESSLLDGSRQIENIREQIPFLDQKLAHLAGQLLPLQHCHFSRPKMDLEIIVSKDAHNEVLIHFCEISSEEHSLVCRELINSVKMMCRECLN